MDNMGSILVINAGSSSIKCALFGAGTESADLPVPLRVQISDIGGRASLLVQREDGNSFTQEVLARSHDEAIETVFAWLARHVPAMDLIACGHRVLHGGNFFAQPVFIDAAVIARLETLVALAPLHQPHNLAAIRAVEQFRPGLRQVACFDSAFHHTLPRVEQIFALPRSFTEAGVKRYGFHGLSYESIASHMPEFMGSRADGRAVVAHLGYGASLCAMKKRRSVATTMSFSPLDGLPMATRSGNVDPGVLLYFLREQGMTVEMLSELLHHRSGLLGISESSGDVRELLRDPDPRAQEAIEYFTYRVAREIGSMAAALGGLDVVVFSGGIGEHAAEIRGQICKRLGWLGLYVNAVANFDGKPCISTSDSAVSAWVIPTDEERVIARHTRELLREEAA